eukprot:TRINITY_DN5807_c2_g1_i1.p1 TRINITY_DN5807_c2_g1~~TRINITY_DN5807_c2_g1_i1.p1  ORF type:complete len:291 (+),score=116.41 TRINITY_DN5807_c2_g1_i1:89-961(+)
MSPSDCRSFTADVGNDLDYASRCTRRAERRMKKALHRAVKGRDMQMMAISLIDANADKNMLQLRNKQLEDAHRVTQTLERAERLVDSGDFADADIAEMLKSLVVSENRIQSASKSANLMRHVSCSYLETSEDMARLALSEAWDSIFDIIQAQVELSARNEAAARQDALGAGLRLWRDEEEGRGGVWHEMKKQWARILALHAPCCDHADDRPADLTPTQLRRALTAERRQREHDVASLQAQMDKVMKLLADSATQDAGGSADLAPGAGGAAMGLGQRAEYGEMDLVHHHQS